MYDFDRISKNAVTFMRTVGRIKQGLTVAQANAAFKSEVRTSDTPWKGREREVALTPLRDELAGALKRPSLILAAAVSLLLLIACANVANLLLSRTAERLDEMAIRSALGASRARLIQQLLTESVALAGAGGIASVLVAQWAVKMASVFQPAELSSQAYTLADWRVAGFAAAVVLVAGLLFGVAPALFAGGALVRNSTPRKGTSRLRSTLVASQVGLTVVLIAGGASLGYAFRSLMATDNGFETRNVISLKISLAGGRYEEPDARRAYCAEAVRRIRELDGTASVGASLFVPLGTSAYMASHFTLDQSGSPEMALILPVTPGFFETMGTRLLAGRTFVDADVKPAEKLVVVSESFARHFMDDPTTVVGRRLTGKGSWTPARIAGVIRPMNFNGPSDSAGSQVFPLMSTATNFVVRVKDDPRLHIAAIKHAVGAVDPQIPIYDVMTMDERLAGNTARPRLYTLATVMFGGCALLLSITGLYGVISYSVTQRTREMGIRMALGTTPAALRLTMLRHGLIVASAGAVPGVIATFFAAHWLKDLVRGAADVTSIACVASLVPIAAVAASSVWMATGRIAKLDPAAALRAE